MKSRLESMLSGQTVLNQVTGAVTGNDGSGDVESGVSRSSTKWRYTIAAPFLVLVMIVVLNLGMEQSVMEMLATSAFGTAKKVRTGANQNSTDIVLGSNQSSVDININRSGDGNSNAKVNVNDNGVNLPSQVAAPTGVDSNKRSSIERHLVHVPECGTGYGNQHECFNLLATFADKWNRTLWLPHNGYCGFFKHDPVGIPLDELFNISRIAVRHRIYQHSRTTNEAAFFGAIPVGACQHSKTRKTFVLQGSDQVIWPDDATMVGEDGPFPDTQCLVHKCVYAQSSVAGDVRSFPKHTELWYPYHDSYYDKADRIVNEMRSNFPSTTSEVPPSSASLSPTTRQSKQGRLLGMHVRRGDRTDSSGPMLDCNGRNMTTRYNPKRRSWWGCYDSKTKTMWDWPTTLAKIGQLYNISSGEYSGVFVATDDPDFVQSHFPQQHKHLLRTLEDFGSVANKTSASSVQALIVEMLVLSQVDDIMFTYPSTVGEHVLRYRLQRNRYSDYDVSLYRLHMHSLNQMAKNNISQMVLRDYA